MAKEPIRLKQNKLDGLYIGKYIEYLSEKELFQILSDQWQIHEIFKKKMLSGQLHSDRTIIYDQKRTPTGYKAHMRQRRHKQQEAVITWEIKDFFSKEINSKFKKINQRIFTLNFMPHSHWLRFKIHNPYDKSVTLILELDKHLFSIMDIYTLSGKDILTKHLDFIQNIQARELADKHLAAALTIKPGVNTCYLRLDSWFVDIIPLRIWTQQEFQNHSLIDNAFLGIIIGLFLFVIVYALSTFLFIRDFSYIYLALMTLCSLFIHLCVSGFGFQFIWHFNSQWSVYGLYLAFPLSFVFFLLFSRSFLETHTYTPKFDRLFWAMIVFFALIFLSFFVLPVYIRNFVLLLLIISDNCFYLPVLFPVLVTIKSGNRAGIYMLIGILLYFAASIEWMLSSFDIIPYQWINYLHIKGISFLILMMLGLFDKFNGLKNALVCANLDLERKVFQRTKELETANAKLTALDALKTKFFANISHEFRTPLTLILSPIESFLKGDLGKISKSNRCILESMRKNAHRLLRLISNLLDLSKIEAGKMAIQKKKCNLSKLTVNCISQLHSLANSEKVQMIFSDQANDLMVSIDPALMEKAIINLLSNAIKFNRPKGIIRVTLKKENKEAILQVEDSGIGIPKEHLGSIFDRFYQIDTSTTRKYEGTGIGLSLVKEIIQLHAGEITVESKLNQGTTFRIKLPVSHLSIIASDIKDTLGISESDKVFTPFQNCANENNLEQNIETVPAAHNKNGITILIVEDNTDMRNYLKQLLGKDYQTITADNGFTALKKMEERRIDLVLADVMMPGMDGYKLIQKIRAQERYVDLPILMLSAKADAYDRVTGIEKGANDYIIKPFNSKELLSRIASQLKFKQLRQRIIDITLKQKRNNKPLTDHTKLKIKKVKAFLKENYADDISRKELALAVDMSPDHLGRMFKKYTGEKISSYLNRIRIEIASKKLLESNDKIIDIAFEVGFGSLRTFNHKFLDLMGTSPSNYKKKM
ncbi:MAG: ATP-binding protein [Desulfobacteraceae bacterium]|jgi:signal transduction histidine kinase/DNA-binding response OmpR family regulator